MAVSKEVREGEPVADLQQEAHELRERVQQMNTAESSGLVTPDVLQMTPEQLHGAIETYRREVTKLTDANQARQEDIKQLKQDLRGELDAAEAKMAEESARLDDAISRAEKELTRLRKTGVIFLSGVDGIRDRLILAQCDVRGFSVAKPENAQHGMRYKTKFAVEEWFKANVLDDHHIVIAIKPGGVDRFLRLQSYLQQRKLSFGIELLDDDENLVVTAE